MRATLETKHQIKIECVILIKDSLVYNIFALYLYIVHSVTKILTPQCILIKHYSTKVKNTSQ